MDKSMIDGFRIFPGDFYATKSSPDVVISTLLGSCVSACLFDSVNQVMGMNHFMLVNSLNSQINGIDHSEAGRYGVHSMELLINKMLKLGALKKNIKAKFFGGANVLLSGLSSDTKAMLEIGKKNIDFIKEFFQVEGISVVSSDTGGNNGRKIYFLGRDFSVFVRKVKSSRSQAVLNEENQYYKTLVKKVKTQTPKVVLW